MTYARRIRLAPMWVALALALAIVLLAFTVVPAFAIVDTVTPICTGEAASNEAAGGKASGANSTGSPVGPPFPAQGGARSGDHACE